MSMEESNNYPELADHKGEDMGPATEEEMESGMQLINEHPLLSQDRFSKDVVEKGGWVRKGVVVDIGNFLAARAAHLENIQSEAKLAAAASKDPQSYDAAVTYSVRPDLEGH